MLKQAVLIWLLTVIDAGGCGITILLILRIAINKCLRYNSLFSSKKYFK